MKSVHPFKVGHINETFISTWDCEGDEKRYLHQKINSYVFQDVPGVMGNIEKAIAHIRNKRGSTTRETLAIVPTVSGATYYQDPEGGYWRTYPFIENTVAFEVCTEPRQAYEAARVLGRFLSHLSDCNASDFIETIPLFQNVPNRIRQLEEAVKKDSEGRVAEVAREIEFAFERREEAATVEELRQSGAIPTRVTHSDPKFNNVLFDSLPNGGYGDGLAVVDLDTVMPGTMLYDFGDLARSIVISAREDEVDLSKIVVNEPLFEELVKGYIREAGVLLTKDEIALIPIAPRLIALSLGARFLADYLAGDIYFKIHRLKHNLDRARAQFKIVEEMEGAEDRMRRIVQRVSGVSV